MGLVSFYSGTQPGLYATKLFHFVDIQMSDYQDDVYSYFEEIEAKIAMSQTGSKTYKVYTRQACNFVFPAIDQQVNGENRPRPNKFKLSERDALKLIEKGDIKEKDKDKLVHTSMHSLLLLQIILCKRVNKTRSLTTQS